ncbi:MAG: FG-GAP-like repeat-containing protein [Mangrovibacterium sp.]
MKKIIVIVLVVCFHQPVLWSQEINELPAGLNTTALPDSLRTGAFTRLHRYSDYIYNSNKLLSADSTGYRINPNETWGQGSWGRGYFSWYVDQFLFNGDSSRVNYNRWYRERWSCHPLVRDNARRLVAYVYQYKAGDRREEYIDKIAAGIKYLIEQQNNNKRSGSFLWWNFRKVLDLPDASEIPDGNAMDAEYETSLALYALTEGYLFLKQFDEPGYRLLLEQALSAIHISAKWCFVRSLGYEVTMPDPKYSGKIKPSINYRAYTILGLVQAYRATSDLVYLRRAADIYVKCIKDFQDDNGAWYYGDKANPNYHDAKPYYMGITLRGLVLLYELLDPAFDESENIQVKTSLAGSIYSTINHFLDKGVAGPEVCRLDVDGRIRQYKMEPGRGYKIAGGQFNQGIKYALESSLFSDRDKEILRGILNGSLRATANETLNGYNLSEIDMLSLSMYKCTSEDFFGKPQSRAGLACYKSERAGRNAVTIHKPGSGQVHKGKITTEKEFDLMVTGDFDHDGKDELAFYRKSDGKIIVYPAGSDYSERSRLGTIDTDIRTFSLMQPVDYDHDGFPEIALYSSASGHLIHIYRLGMDTPLHTGHIATQEAFGLCSIGDFNYDGKDELAFYRKSDGDIVIYKPDGKSGGFSESGRIQTGIKTFELMNTVDYDHDGCPEIVLYSPESDHAVNIYRLGSGTPVHSGHITTKHPFTRLSMGDFDGDGKDELAFYHPSGYVTCYDVKGKYDKAGGEKTIQIGSKLKLMATLFTF